MKKFIAAALAAIAVTTAFASCTQPENPDANGTTTRNPYSSNTPSDVTMSFTDVNDKMYVNTDNLNVRSTPDSSSNSNVVGQLSKGTEVNRTGFNADWSRIVYQGNVRYVATSYLSAEKVTTDDPTKPTDTAVPDDKFTEVNETVFVYPTQDKSGKDVYVKGGEVNAYYTASFGDWAAKFKDGTKLTRTGITKENNTEYGWSRVKADDGKTYYIRNSQLTTVDPNGSSATTTAKPETTEKPTEGTTKAAS